MIIFYLTEDICVVSVLAFQVMRNLGCGKAIRIYLFHLLFRFIVSPANFRQTNEFP